MHCERACLDNSCVYSTAFAVVPCCVFANDFPERKVSKGKLVETVDDLIEWIKIKCKKVGEPKTGFLPMVSQQKQSSLCFMNNEKV